METAAAIASVAPPQPQPHSIPIVAASGPLIAYNISLNLSSILAMIPGSRFLSRLRRGAYETPLGASATGASLVEEVASASTSNTSRRGSAVDGLPAFPGPWGFFTSGYMIGLFVMAILLHRIQNVIIPSRIPSRRSRHGYRFPPSSFASSVHHRLILHRIYTTLVPVDFSKTSTRLALHLPSIYFLTKMLFLWFLLVLQTSGLFPSFTNEQKFAWWSVLGWIETAGIWSSQKHMSEICWSTFCAVCSAFLVEGFIKALDGIGSGFPIGNVNPNTSPFNLVGYAFLLHIYSSPIAHAYKPDNGNPSRPDKHVVITIAIPLLQLTIFHILSVSKRLSTHRLLPTTLTSMLSLAHFHGTLFLHFIRPSTTKKVPRSPPYMGSANYPLLNYIPNIFETSLICTILLTVFLNVVVQLLVRGKVDRMFSGLGVRHVYDEDDGTSSAGFFQSLPFDEDFSVLLLRVGTASLEATGLRGWGNEVAPVRLPARKRARGFRDIREVEFEQPQTYGMVRMGRTGVGEVRYGTSSAVNSGWLHSSNSRLRADRLPRRQRGFSNEVRHVDLGTAQGGYRVNGWWRWIKELTPFLGALWGVLKGLVVLLIERARGRISAKEQARQSHPGGNRLGAEPGEVADSLDEVKKQSRREEVYARFLKGEDISDDDDETEDDYDDDDGDGDDTDSETQFQDDADSEGAGEAEAIQLFTDLIRNAPESTGSTRGGGEIVLAHLVHGEGPFSGPLTRRRWGTLVGNEGSNAQRRRRDNDFLDELDWETSLNREDEDQLAREGRSNNTCVICTSEGRDIICWPCRCLAMCDHCREALASRSAPTKHRCPCCRQTVDGYSRIYIP